MFLAAVLVATAVSSQRQDIRAALVTLGGMAMISAGSDLVVIGWSDFTSQSWPNAYPALGGFMGIILGWVMLTLGKRHIFCYLNEWWARRFLLQGLVGMVFAVTGVFGSPGSDTLALPVIGLCIAFIGGGLVVLVPPERVQHIKTWWRELTRPRGPEEQEFSWRQAGQAVVRFLESYDTVGLAIPHTQSVEPESDPPKQL